METVEESVVEISQIHIVKAEVFVAKAVPIMLAAIVLIKMVDNALSDVNMGEIFVTNKLLERELVIKKEL